MAQQSNVKQAKPKGGKKRPLIANRYEVVNSLSGGMGIVYLCQDKQTKQLVALKTFKPEYLPHLAARDLFLREGTMWVEIGKHPNVVQAYRVERVGNGKEIYLVLEWIVQPKGKKTPSLRSWLRNGQTIPHDQALLFCLHVARGMKFAVNKIPGLVHRDLKPENILVGYDGIARVTDFGLASTISGIIYEDSTIHNGERSNFNRTQMTQGIAGTPLYMAPEQWNKAHLDARADIYALGCIFYEMITGKFAAKADSKEGIRAIHLSGKIEPPPADTPMPVLQVMRKSLHVSRDKRFRNWAEAEQAFAEAYEAVSGKYAPPERMETAVSEAETLAAGHSYNTMGLSYLDIGKLDVAVMYFEQAVRIGREHQSLELEGDGLGNLGLAYMSLGYFDRAIQFHEEHLTIARETDNLEAEGRALGRLGDVYLRRRNPERAVGLHQRELEIFQQLEDHFQEAAALHSLGETYRQMQNYEQAESFYKSSQGIARTIGDRHRTERILNSTGLLYADLGKIKEAAKMFQQAIEISREIGDPLGESEVAANLGDLFFEQNHLKKAVELYLRSLRIAQENNDLRRQVRNYNQLGEVYLRLNAPDKAQAQFEESLRATRSTGDENQLLRTSVRLSDTMLLQKDYMQASRVLKRALLIAREQENLNRERQILVNLGQVYQGWGDISRMTSYLQESLTISEQLQDVDAQADTLRNIGLTNQRAKQWQASVNAFQALQQLYQEHKDKEGEANALIYLGNTTLDGGDLSLAYDFYKQALDIARQHSLLEIEASSYGNLGKVYQLQNKKWRANSQMDKALTAAKKSKNYDLIADISLQTAHVFIKQGKWDKAHPHAERAAKIYGQQKAEENFKKTKRLLGEIKKNKGKSTGFFS